MHILRYPLTSPIDKYNEFSEIKVIQMLQRILKMLLVNILSYRKVIYDPDSMYFPQKKISSNNTREKKEIVFNSSHSNFYQILKSDQIYQILYKAFWSYCAHLNQWDYSVLPEKTCI